MHLNVFQYIIYLWITSFSFQFQFWVVYVIDKFGYLFIWAIHVGVLWFQITARYTIFVISIQVCFSKNIYYLKKLLVDCAS